MSEVTLSPEQRKVIETWREGMAVQAGAGSGKTTTLVLKCRELLRLKPDARFAAVSFTERSASDLRAKLSASLPPKDGGGPLSGHWVMTIHGLCGAILREYPREAGYDGEESMLSEGEAQLLWERAIEQLWQDPGQQELRSNLEDARRKLNDALELLLARESRDSLGSLLKRARDLESSGLLESLHAQDDPASRALATVAGFVLERYERLKRRRGALDFNDLEKGADRALEHAAVREAYRRRFDLVLVDEFQDTNAVQARIILHFVKPDLSNLCVVGDPKQSIYRFRDADVSVFDEFCAKLPVQAALTWNFRSRPGVLELANRVCEKAFASSGMAYQALVPKRPAMDEGKEGFEPVAKVPVDRPQDLAKWILAEQARGVPLQDMALLLRKIRGNERWLKALTSAGIPIAVGSGGLFWEDPRTRELVAFLKWWDNPANTLSGAIFLRAPWVGIPDLELDRWNREDRTWTQPFFASSHPLARVLASYRGKTLRPGELLMALLSGPASIERELGATLLGLWHRAEELSTRGLDFHAAVAELASATEERRRERDVPPPRNTGQLQVLTLHGAKGLEFPHVLLLDLGKKNRAANSPLLYWDRAKGAYLARRDADGERIEDELARQWKKEEREKELAESKRVFYVALTRARERLVLVCPALPDSDRDDSAHSEEVYGQDFWRGWLEASGALACAKEAGVTESAPGVKPETAGSGPADSHVPHPVTSAVKLRRPRHSVTEWNLLSRCPRAYEWTYIRPHAEDGERSARLRERLAIGGQGRAEGEELSQRELGTEVHSCLETGDYDRLEELEQKAGSDRFRASAVREWAVSSPWMKPESGEAYSELAFEVPVAGEVLVGSMDRALVSESRRAVIDFKVTRHEKSSDALLEAYGTQMELYRWALGRLLGEHDPSKIAAHLVNFSDAGVHELEVPPSPRDPDRFIEELARLSARIVSGEEGKPRPGPQCQVCRFRSECLPEI